MKTIEAINQKVVSCSIDARFIPERTNSVTLMPDAKISVENNGCTYNYEKGLTIVLYARHNGSKEDMLQAIEDLKLMVASFQ